MDGITKFKDLELSRKIRANLDREDVNQRIVLVRRFMQGFIVLLTFALWLFNP
tara:strand:+ start:1338 stop:1496 length:159 start_codon:yes stop_codon:yes gene_type:complete